MLIQFSLLLLAFVVAIEASTSLARIAGFSQNSPYSGLSLESALSLFSRIAMAIFTPIFGLLADTDRFSANRESILLGSLFMPLAILLVRLYEAPIISIYSRICHGLLVRGSFLRSFLAWKDFRSGESKIYRQKTYHLSRTRLSNLQFIHFIVYIPYYASWPSTMMLVSYFHQYRATILSLNTLLTSFSSILLILFFDPLMVRLSPSPRISQLIYHRFLTSRVLASFASFLVLLLVFKVIF
jgi:hypothetical protein